MIEYLLCHPDKILIPLLQHIELVLITLLISLAIAIVLTMLFIRFPGLGTFLSNLFAVTYSITSLALFSLMISITGLGTTTAVRSMRHY